MVLNMCLLVERYNIHSKTLERQGGKGTWVYYIDSYGGQALGQPQIILPPSVYTFV